MRKLFAVIVATALFVFTASVIIAQEIESSPSATASATPAPSVEYFLPYPGLLPDHPLYLLKSFRDRILAILIADPVKRVEFNLLMADKRLNMGIFLSEKGKEQLAESTISQGEEYLLTAVEQFGALAGKQQNLEVLTDKLKAAVVKHEAVVTQMKDKASKEYQKGYTASLQTIKTSQEKLQGL